MPLHIGVPPLQNVLRGNVPTFGGFSDVNPSNLQNATDGDTASATGVGQKVMATAGIFGSITFDLGTQKTILVYGRINIYSSAGTQQVFVETSDDNITWRTYPSAAYTKATASSANIIELLATIVSGRYMRLNLYVNAAATCYTAIHEIAAWELRL